MGWALRGARVSLEHSTEHLNQLLVNANQEHTLQVHESCAGSGVQRVGGNGAAGDW